MRTSSNGDPDTDLVIDQHSCVILERRSLADNLGLAPAHPAGRHGGRCTRYPRRWSFGSSSPKCDTVLLLPWLHDGKRYSMSSPNHEALDTGSPRSQGDEEGLQAGSFFPPPPHRVHRGCVRQTRSPARVEPPNVAQCRSLGRPALAE